MVHLNHIEMSIANRFRALVEAFKNLLSVYGNFTGPIINSPSFAKGS
jgi:hypothetical protein